MALTNAQVRTAGLHLGTATAAALATAMWMATRSVDMYAIIDQVNVVIADIAKLITTVTVFVTGAIAVYKGSTKGNLEDAAADPKGPEVAAAMPVTPESTAVANAMTKTP